MQRDFDREVLQVVLACPFQDETRRVRRHQAFETQAHRFARPQVSASEGVGVAGSGGAAVEHDLAAAFTWPGAHVDEAVGGEHHGGVVLHHHQGVAGVAQALHGLHDAIHVTRMQADAGFIQHKQRVHERGAQRRGEVDALHLPAGERAALPIQRQITQAHVTQVIQPGADLGQQQFERLIGGTAGGRCGVGGDQVEELAQARQRQQHQIVDGEAGQRFKLGAAPRHALRQETLGRGQHGVGIRFGAQAPEQGVGLEACAAAVTARGVAAVLGEQHADVHLVGLALQVSEEAANAVPLLVPLAFFPIRLAFDHPGTLLGRELVPRRVTRDAGGAGVFQQIVLALFPGGGLNRFDGAVAQRLALIWDHQPPIDANHPAKTPAGVTRAVG